MSDNRPIGIFDSGVGGITVWKELAKLLPGERTIYLADAKNAPYGAQPKSAILEFSIKNTEVLIARKCKLIVVACNTATTNAISFLREHYQLPFVGIEPAIKPAALATKTKKVGVLATKGTLASSLFHKTAKEHAAGIQIMEQEGKGLVELIEKGNIDTEETRALLQRYLQPMVDHGMDSLVLGCTHYPFLTKILGELLPPHIQIIDSGPPVARQVKAVLAEKQLLGDRGQGPSRLHEFYTNGEKAVLMPLVPQEASRVAHLDF